MAGSLTIGGLMAGMLTGEKVIGPITIAGKIIVGSITDVELAAGDNTVAVPKEATAALIAFPFASSPPEVKIRTSKNAGDAGLPTAATGFFVVPLVSGTTSLIINGAVTGVTELSFV
jgi:hypothetical protein